MGFVAGSFTAKFKPAGGAFAGIGRTEEGFEIENVPHVQPIVTDDMGQAQVNGVNQGLDVLVTFSGAEYDLIEPLLFATHPQGEANTNVGQLQSDLAGQLVLTPVAGTPAATLLGAGKSYVFPLAYSEGNMRLLCSSKWRRGPVTLRCLPHQSTLKHYTVIDTPS